MILSVSRVALHFCYTWQLASKILDREVHGALHVHVGRGTLQVTGGRAEVGPLVKASGLGGLCIVFCLGFGLCGF